MKPIGRSVAAAVAAGVLLGVLTGCGGSSGSRAGSTDAKQATGSAAASASPGGTAAGGVPSTAAGGAAPGGGTAPAPGAATPGAPAPGGTAPAGGAASGPAPAPVWSDAPTPLLEYRVVLQLMPDKAALPGWEEDKRRVDVTDRSADCRTAEASCKGKPLSGEARFTSGDTTARFLVDTLPTKAAAQERLKTAYAAFGDNRYQAAELPVVGTESKAWQGRPGGGSEGVSIVMRAGTVVATVTTEEGPVDPKLTQRLATMLAQRIEQAQSGRAADAVLAP